MMTIAPWPPGGRPARSALLADRLRDPWDTFEVTGPEDVRARLCPLCSAWVWSVEKHRSWHLEPHEEEQ